MINNQFHTSDDIKLHGAYAFTQKIKENGLCFIVEKIGTDMVDGIKIGVNGVKKQNYTMDWFLTLLDQDTLSYIEVTPKKELKEIRKNLVD